MRFSRGTVTAQTIFLIVVLIVVIGLLWAAIQRADWPLAGAIGVGIVFIVLKLFEPGREGRS